MVFSNDYEMFVNSVNVGRENVLSFKDLYGIFLTKEMCKNENNKKESEYVAL